MYWDGGGGDCGFMAVLDCEVTARHDLQKGVRTGDERCDAVTSRRGCSMEEDSLAERIVRGGSEDSLLVAQGEDGLCRRRIGCRWGWLDRPVIQATGAVWELQVAERCACGLFAAPRRTCLPRCAVLSVRGCVRTGMAWSSDLLSGLARMVVGVAVALVGLRLVRTEFAHLHSCVQGRVEPRSVYKAPHAEGQRRRHGGSGAGQQSEGRAWMRDVGRAARGGRGGRVGAPGRGCAGTWVRRDVGA